MADVTGNIGGQSVELNNAATEATLKQLVKAVGMLAAKSGGSGAKSQKEVDAELKKFHKMLRDTTDQGKKLTKAEKDKLKAQEDATRASELEADRKKKAAFVTEKSISGVQWFTKTAESAALGLVGLGNDIANLGNSMTSAAALFSKLPLVGGLLGTTFGAVAAQSEKLLGAFQNAASVGAGFGGSIQEMTNAASAAGMTVDKFGALLAANGPQIALLGKGSTDGARAFSRMTKEIRSSGAAAELMRLGYSTEQINGGMAGFASRLQQTGKLQGMTTAQVTQATASYLKELDAVARLTGKNREAMQKEEEQRMKDAQYMAFKRKLDAQGQKELEMIMQSLPAELQEGAKEVLATGTATSDAGVAFLAYMNKSGQNLAVLGDTARRTGTIQAGAAAQVSAMVQDEAKALADSPLGDTIARFGDDAQKRFMAGAYDAAARQGKLAEIQKQQQEEAKKRKEQEEELKKKGLDPAAMVGFQENIAKMSNQFSVLLASHLPMLQRAFDILTKVINEYIAPALTFFMDNLKAIVIGFVALKGIMLVVGGALKAWNFFQQTKGTLMNPMIVKDIAGGGIDLPGKGGKGGALGKAGGALGKAAGAAKAMGTVGNMAKGAGVVGAVVSAGMLVSDLSDISDREKKGEITKEEAKKERGGAVGGAAGGTGGAMAGAAAGAAIGSVVPVVGTIIGGLIGGAVGGWLGREGGKIVGEAVMDSPKKPGSPQTPVAGTPAAKTAVATTAGAGSAQLAEIEKKKSEAEKLTTEQAQQMQAMLAGGNPTKLSQEQMSKAMEQLNTNTAEMVKLLKNQTTISERQLDVTKGLGSADIFVAA
jgi:hypothetical protein